jgi:epoxyqueuosine reductase
MATDNLSDELKSWIAARGRKYGFESCQITQARLPAPVGAGLDAFVDAGHHGEMRWLKETRQRRYTPQAMWDEAQTAIIFGCNYGPNHNPLETLEHRQKANISVYARGRDYHEVLKGRLKQIASQLHTKSGWQVKIFVDTAPLMEKPLAARAGLGWQGKHTNLVSREFGSWLFLGTILTSGKLEPDRPEKDNCGSCTACLDICPTNAFPAPYKLDARRCISYLTIEFDGHIPLEFRAPMQNRVFGCDDCLAVCPWNKFAAASSDIKLASGDKILPDLSVLLRFDDSEFRAFFSKTPVKRTGYLRFMRNVLIAAGNADQPSLIPLITPYLQHVDARLRAMAVWALSCYLSKADLGELRSEEEADSQVIAEWQNALSQ